jgi:hypothetical protein
LSRIKAKLSVNTAEVIANDRLNGNIRNAGVRNRSLRRADGKGLRGTRKGAEMMIYEINRLIDADHPLIQRTGWLMYDREEGTGLTEDQTEQLTEILGEIADELAEVPEADELYNAGYADGYAEGVKVNTPKSDLSKMTEAIQILSKEES